MTIDSQINKVYHNRGSIMRLMRQFVVTRGNLRSSFEWKEIPLDESDFNNACQELEVPQIIVNESKKVLRNILGTASDGKIVLLNTSFYNKASFTIKIIRNSDTKKQNDATHSSEMHTWKVTCTDGSANRFRTVRAKTEEDAVKNALYSLQYDNKREFKLCSTECLN